MSMFYELMMKKKGGASNLIYATIKGSLTNNNDVITFNDSVANYLKLQQAIAPTTPFEIKIKFNYTNNSYAALFHSHMEYDKYGIGLNVENDKLNYFVSTVNSGAWAFDMYSDNSLSQNTDYYVKFGWSGTEYYADLSTDDVNYSRVISFLSNEEPRHDIAITQMGNYNDSYSLQGSIDLPNSYIKLGSTKYKLQAVVGYTIVGSPTIVDGVVSGFSSSDYLTISQSSGTVNSIEIIIKVQDIASTITHTGLIIGLNGNLNSRLAIGTNDRVQCNYKDVDNTTRYMSSSKQASEYNYMRVKFNTSGASLDVSTDGITWINEYSREEIPNLENAFTSCSMGYISNTYNSFEGGINMPKTSIKLNNKLWFNGQQA